MFKFHQIMYSESHCDVKILVLCLYVTSYEFCKLALYGMLNFYDMFPIWC